jgi:hypothetical protein
LKGLHDNKETGLKRTITIIPTETTWTFFTNCHRRNRIASATFLLSQDLARSVNLSSNTFEQQLNTEGINCLDINRKFPHFKKERQWEPSAIELFGKSNINIMIDVKNYKKISILIRNNNKKALKKCYAKVQKSYCFSSWISNSENWEENFQEPTLWKNGTKLQATTTSDARVEVIETETAEKLLRLL